MNRKALECIVAQKFFKKYTKINSYTHKMRGKNGMGKEIRFTSDEIGQIKKGVILMCQDILKRL